MSRILLVSNYGWTVYNFRRNLIQELRRAGYDVFVQTEFDGYEKRLGLEAERILPLDIDRKGVNPIWDVRTIYSVYQAIRTVRADVCLFFTIKPVVYGGIAATLRSVPFVCNVTGLGSAFIGSAWLKFTATTLYKFGLAGAARIFFQNSNDMQLFLDGRLANPARAELLPGSGVDLSRFLPTPVPAGSSQVFLLIARLLWDKGVGEFVEAARLVKVKRPNVRFQLVGPLGVVNPSAISRKTMEAWVREGAVEYLGETDDVVPLIIAADCVVLPSYYGEGIPRTLLEAAATGRPVITTDHVGCRDAVTDGATGLLCKAKDARDLADKIERMISMSSSERAEMGRRGRAKMEHEFDERFVISRYLNVVGEITGSWRSVNNGQQARAQ